MKLTVTPAQFDALKTALSQAEGVNLIITVPPNQGTMTTRGVTLSCLYDGAAELDVTITAKHGLARFAGDQMIYDQVQQQFEKYIGGA